MFYIRKYSTINCLKWKTCKLNSNMLMSNLPSCTWNLTIWIWEVVVLIFHVQLQIEPFLCQWQKKKWLSFNTTCTLNFLAHCKNCVAGWLYITTQNYALLKSSLKSCKLFDIFAMETPTKWIFPLFELPRGGGEYFLELVVKRTSILKQALTGIY